MVVETGVGDVGLAQIVVEVRAATSRPQCAVPRRQIGRRREVLLKLFVFVYNLYSMLEVLGSRLVADCSKVAVHDLGLKNRALASVAHSEGALAMVVGRA